MKFISKFFSYLALFIAAATSFSPYLVTKASIINNSLGISGPFANYVYTMVPDETLSHPNVYVRLFNNFSVDIEIQTFYEAPEGVSITLNEGLYSLTSGSSIELPVEISTDITAAPGTYRIFYGANVVEETVSGINVITSARLGATLIILGEAGDVSITTLTPNGNPMPARVDLYRQGSGTFPWIPIRQSMDGTLDARLAVGTYKVTATYDDYLLDEEIFSLSHREDKVVTLIANLVQVTSFDVEPQYYESEEEEDLLGSIRATYSIKTIFEPLENIRIYMMVYLNETFLEKTLIANIVELGIGEFTFYQNFVPSAGWQVGVFTFHLEAYKVESDLTETLFGNSPSESATITGSDLPTPPIAIQEVIPWWLVALLLMFTVLAIEIALWIQKRKLKLVPILKSSQEDVCELSHQSLLKAVVLYQSLDDSTHPHEKAEALQQLLQTMEAFVTCMKDRIHLIKSDPVVQKATDILKQNK